MAGCAHNALQGLMAGREADFCPKPLPIPEPLLPPPPRAHVPWQGESTSHATYVPHPIERMVLLPPPPPGVMPPFYGTSTSHADFPAHAPVRQRPSVGLATAGGSLHVLVPGIIPLPAAGTAELTTCHDGQTEMQLLVCEGEEARGSRLLAALPFGGLPAKRRRGDVTVRQQEGGSLEVLAECAESRPQRRAWTIRTGADGAAAQVVALAC
ncbi:hypothetical protein ABPG75_010263 [Micractinium tetrahymenae]